MYVSGFSSASFELVDPHLRELAGELRAERPVVSPGELVDDHPAGVVTVARVLAAGVAETDDEQIERRGALAPTEEAHYSSDRSRSRTRPQPRPRGSRPRPPRPRGLLALGQLLALLGLGLDLDDRGGDGGDHGLVRVVEEHDALERRQIFEPERVAHLEPADVGLDRLRDLHRQRLDVERRRGLVEDAALLDSGRVLGPVQVDVDGRLDRDVEPHFLQVDVADVAANRIALVLLQDRRMLGGLALEHDVEHGVQAGRAGQRSAEIALADDERLRRRAAVENAGNEPLLAQAPRLGRAEPVAFLHLETKSVAGHGGGL